MNCQECGKELEEGAKFCVHCGAKNTSDESPANNAVKTEEELAATATASSASANNALNVVTSYLDFAKKAVLTPTDAGAAVSKNEWLFGLISLVLFVLFLPLTFFTYISRVSMGFIQVSFMEGFVQPVILLALLFGVLLVIMFGLLKAMGTEISFQKLIALFGSINTISAGLMIVAFLLTLVNILSLSLFLILLSTFSLFAGIIYSYYQLNQSNKGMDPFHASLITFVAIIIIINLIGESILREMIQQFSLF
ncbi:zinc ribbon domain-containing protein [Salibacterium salarium]|uniref:Zinc ribbon domain-containing protein n=1 Tax=Salibacterium salarium TaxID=284579 RepID=A0A428NAL7_9BACI|nr:zinc ribbon domain-containing protein [Salibacterium salarium]RSL35380.1 zinc ribbon domain-containing protein [Salibacterium salarium]